MLFVDMFWCVNDSYLAKVLSSVLQIASACNGCNTIFSGNSTVKVMSTFFTLTG